MSMEDMDPKVRSLSEQARYELKKGSSSTSTRDALIAQIAAYLASADLTSSDRSHLYAKLEELKNS